MRTIPLFLSVLSALGLGAATASAQPAPLPVDVAAQPVLDVIELTNGSEYRGLIIEQVPAVSYTIQLVAGRVVVVAIADVARVRKEANPAAAGPTPTPNVPPTSSPPVDVGARGTPLTPPARQPFGEVGIALTSALPIGKFGDTAAIVGLGPKLELGYVMPRGNLDVAVGFSGRHLFWLHGGRDEAGFDTGFAVLMTVDPHLYGRVASGVGKIRPQLTVSIGPELNMEAGDNGFFNRTAPMRISAKGSKGSATRSRRTSTQSVRPGWASA
jgi:hypothetical protein